MPVAREFPADTLTPVVAYAAITRPPFGFLLESLVGGERWARYTFLGTDPREAWRYGSGTAERWSPDRGWEAVGRVPDPLAHIGNRMRALKAARLEGLPRFIGGAVGYLGYDAVRAIEKLPGGPIDDIGLPDALFMIADTLIIIDNAFGRATVVANKEIHPGAGNSEIQRAYSDAQERIDSLLSRLSHPLRVDPIQLTRAVPARPQTPYAQVSFVEGVNRIKEYIRRGDIFQVVLSRRQDVGCRADPFRVYRTLRALNPAPYLYFLQLDDLAIAGSSPEVLVRVEDREITARPIAGTRPRGPDPTADEVLARELLSDEKELAEHAMLVDLSRNDVGRAAEYGTVQLSEDKAIERYSHVQHIVSEVRGRLRQGLDAVDVLRCCFPAGTVTGAPKVRAMQIIDELEPTRRGPYAGAVGYIGWGATNLDTAIAIRTVLLSKGQAYVQAGAGVVADSDPARELDETEDKSRAMLGALAVAEQD